MAVGPGYFEQQASSYAPIAGGSPYQPTYGYEGLPGSNMGGMAGSVVNMLLPQMMQMIQQRTGMMPMGLHGQNIADSLQQQRFTRLHDDLIRQAAETDKRAMMDTWRGLAAVSGTPWTADVRQSARQLTQITGTMLPTLVQTMPNLVDQLGGLRGSAAVMSHYMHLGGRYRLDPATGQMGMSVNTVKDIANQIFERDFSADPAIREKANQRIFGQDWMRTHMPGATRPPITYDVGAGGELVPRGKDLRDTYELMTGAPARYGQQVGDLAGMSAGQFGLLFDQMTRRGMIRSDDRSARERTLAAMADTDPRDLDLMGLGAIAHRRGLQKEKGAFNLDMQKISGEELDVLREDPAVQARLRQMDASRISDQIRSYSKAIAAVRDIFGDRGQPNAPMKELLAGLESMTGGNLAQIEPGRLEMMVRNTYNLAQQTGIGLDQAMMIQGHGAQMAQSLGIEPIFAAGALQGNLAFGGAYRGRGMNAPHLAAWGRLGSDQAQQLDMGLRMRAAASRQTNQMAAALRMGEAMAPEGGFKGMAGRYMAALRAGETEFENAAGKMISVDLNESAFRTMMGEAGVDSDTISQMLEDQFTNREFAEKHGLPNLVRKLQPREMKAFAQDQIESGIYQRVFRELTSNGMDATEADKKARAIASKGAQSVGSALFNASPEQITNRESRNRLMADAMKGAFAGTAAENFGPGFNRMTSEMVYGQLDTAVRSKYRGFGGAQGMFQMMDPVTLAEADRQARRAQFTSERQSALAGLGQGGVLRRVMSEVQKADKTDLTKVLGAALGMVSNRDVRERLKQHYADVHSKGAEIRGLEDQIINTKDPKRRQELIERRQKLMDEYQAEIDKIVTTGKDSGLFTGGAYGLEDIEAASAAVDRLSELTEDLPAFADRGQADKFWKSRQGQEYRRAVGTAMTNVDDMIQSVADSSDLAQRVGPGGLKRIKELYKSQQKIRELAATYTGGDVAALVAGDFEDKHKAKIMEQINKVRGQQKKAMQEVEQAMEKEFKPPEEMTDKFKKDLANLRKELGGGDPRKRLERMLQTYGIENVTADQLGGLSDAFARGGGADFVDSAIATRQTLADYAKKQGISVEELMKKYRGKTDEETIEKINKSNLPDEVREAMMFQVRTGMGGMGKGDTAKSVGEYLESGYAAGAEAYADVDEKDDPQGFKGHWEISGTLNLQNGGVKGEAKGRNDVLQPT